jgi:hypothetical protein
MHEKALLTASVFGLPMFSINMGGSRDTSVAAVRRSPEQRSRRDVRRSRLSNSDFQVPAAATPGPLERPIHRRNGVASNPGEPALPRYVANVDVPGKVLRGVGFRSGAFADTNGVKPFTGRRARSSAAPRPSSRHRRSIRPGSGPPATSPS